MMKQQPKQSIEATKSLSKTSNKVHTQEINTKTKSIQLLPDKINTINDSLVYIKKLIGLTVSNITYLRMLLNEDCYAERMFEGINVKILKDGSNSESVKNLNNWLVGVYDAIDKKYLRSMVLAFYNDINNPDTVLETYEFGFRYADNEAVMSLNVNDKTSIVLKATKNATRILRTLYISSSTFEPLPEETYITIKLYYYDDVTPMDYEPPYFQPARNENFNFVGEKVNIEVGRVNTLWHFMKLDIKISNEMLKECDDFGDLPINKRKKNLLDDTKSSFVDSDATFDVDHTKLYNFKENSKALDNKKSDQNGKEADVVVKCGCKMNDVILDGLIQCQLCKYWQHKLCFKVKDNISDDLKHICPNCMKNDSTNLKDDEGTFQCLDQSIIDLDENELLKVCKIRRLLNDFIQKSKLAKSEIENKYGADDSTWLLKKLTKESHIKCINSKKHIYEIVNVEETLKSNYIQGTNNKINDTPEFELAGTIDQAVPFTGEQAKNKEIPCSNKTQFDYNNNEDYAESVEICKLTKEIVKTNTLKNKSSPLPYDSTGNPAKKKKVSHGHSRIEKYNKIV